MTCGESVVSPPFLVYDKTRRQVDRVRLVYRVCALLFGASFLLLAAYALNARHFENYRLFYRLAALSPLALFMAIEAWLAGRESRRDRMVSFELFEEYACVRFLYRDDWHMRYNDIASILVRYAGRYPHYDCMRLFLTMRNGRVFRVGRCSGEVLEGLADGLRERCAVGQNAVAGSAAEDRAFRVGQRRSMGLSAAILFGGAAAVGLVYMAGVEREYALVRQLNREGVMVDARMTTQFPRPDRVRVMYLFQLPDRSFEQGYTDLPKDLARGLRQGSTIQVLHLPDDPLVHRGAGAFPRYSGRVRWFGWIGVVVLLTITTVCALGWDALMFRGRLRILRRGELAEDALRL